MRVKLDHLEKKFGKDKAVNDMNLEIEEGEFVAFLGPSGCGKTTTLLMTAGIYRPSEGQILFDGRIVNDVKPKDRDIGMVFQSYALYPHMSVYDNMVFSLKLKKRPVDEMKREALRIAEMMGIDHLLERKPSQLSGGQQQRVALGRALIKKPSLLLFDEPLSNLDARLRISMRGEIKRLQKELGITSIYVTHDQIEAVTMADRVAVMKNGVLQAFTTPEELHNRPANLFIARFIGNPPMNITDIQLTGSSSSLAAAVDGSITLPVPADRQPRASKGNVQMGIRPEDIHIDNQNGFPVLVDMVEALGRDDMIIFRLGTQTMSFLADPGLKLKPGQTVKIKPDMSRVHFFDTDDGCSLLGI